MGRKEGVQCSTMGGESIHGMLCRYDEDLQPNGVGLQRNVLEDVGKPIRIIHPPHRKGFSYIRAKPANSELVSSRYCRPDFNEDDAG